MIKYGSSDSTPNLTAPQQTTVAQFMENGGGAARFWSLH
jgi:hypothetical protein